MNIFRAYDIRGVFPEELNEKTTYSLGRAFVVFLLGKRSIPAGKKLNIAVGRDNRLSSPALFRSLVKGINDQGANVVDFGLSPSPMLYFAAAHLDLDGGINITASHNPPQYNGFKLVGEKAVPISEINGLKEIEKLVLKDSFKKAKPGKVITKQIIQEYARFIFSKAGLKEKNPLKVVVDTANAVAGVWVPEILEKKISKVCHLFSKLDGRFPNHGPNPLVKENLESLSRAVKKEKADLGAAFDGDGDRIVFVDEKGEAIPGDLITALMSELILREKKGVKIFYDVRSSNVVRETIEKEGGNAFPSRIGHSFIKERMREEDVFFAGELTGHYYFKDHYFCESPLFVLFKLAQEIARRKKPFSEIIAPFRKYFHSGEMNFKVSDKEKIIRKMEKKYGSGKLSKVDGVRADFKDWWFLVRSGNTEPLLRLVIEAKTEKLLVEKKEELVREISGS